MSLNFLQETKAFKELLQALRRGEKALSVTGLVESSKPYFLAALLKEVKAFKKGILFIRPSAAPLTRFEEDCQFFFSQWDSVFDTNSLPPLSEGPYSEISPSLDAVSSRMKFFHAVLSKPPSLIVTAYQGILKPFPSPPHLKNLFLELDLGEKFGRGLLIQKLREFGYTPEDILNSRGEYAWRGGIVDVFSPWESSPFRIEFSGDEVASLRTFDLSSQLSVKRVDRILIPSLREYPGTSDFISEWGKRAQKEGSLSCAKDVSEKTKLLERGEIFPSFVFLSLLLQGDFVPFSHYLDDYLYVIDDFDETEKDWEDSLKECKSQYEEIRKEKRFALPPEKMFSPGIRERLQEEAIRLNEFVPSSSRTHFSFSFQSVPRFKNRIPFFLKYLKRLQQERERCFLYFSNETLRQRMASLFSEHEIPCVFLPDSFLDPKDESAGLLIGDLPGGFHFPLEKVLFFAEKDILTEEKVLISRPRVKPFLSHFQDLKTGDCVVHTDFGVGIFKGLIKMEVENDKEEFIEIHYRDEDKLFVPVGNLNLVQKYTKSGAGIPQLSKLGTPEWEKTKGRTKKAIEKIAKELLELYARRKAVSGHSFSTDGTWQEEFEKTFPYEETEDQERAIQEIIKDMESSSPMDRLLCGDVGYGKTEVALRAAFKAALDGKQVALLCPTTVLASQHLKTFQNRFVFFPVRVEGLTRFQKRTKQKKIVEDIKKGLVDIVIGTHRILSKDVQFRDLGLLIIDEEQRFGVSHKEKIKRMKADVDVLTMTATPIPRTLNLSLSGVRDISLIETPPRDRLAIHTVVTPFSPTLIASAIKKELAREGQVYFIHNRVEDIERMAQKIKEWIPQAKVTAVHGQMRSAYLEEKMFAFINQDADILVSTTIIENGIDIPLVNTLIVNRADLFGLAQLYQLRGRVGRSSRQAFAYFLVPPFSELTPVARKRLKALQEFSELGAGFRLAAKDLEIRGAGNFLGAQQHGFMEAVGFDYFMTLLENTIRKLKGEMVEKFHSEINLRVDYRIPEDYLPQVNLRLSLYKRISSAESLQDIERIAEEIKDRYGPLPQSVRNLLRYGAIKFLAEELGIQTIDRLGTQLVFKFLPSSPADLARLTKILPDYSGSLTPQGVLSLVVPAKKESDILDETILILKQLTPL